MVHDNSLTALEEIIDDGSKDARRLAITKVLNKAKRPLRDWDILQRVFPGSTDMNLVRPRITEMYRPPLSSLVEGERGRSHSGNRPVRTSILKCRVVYQLSLF